MDQPNHATIPDADRIAAWRERAQDYDPEAIIPKSQLRRDKHWPGCRPHGVCYCDLSDIVDQLTTQAATEGKP